MAGDVDIKALIKKFEEVEHIIMGDPERPDVPGALENIRRNTEFRRNFQKLVWRAYLVLAGMVAIQIFNLVANRLTGG